MKSKTWIALAALTLTATTALADIKGTWSAEKKKGGIQLETRIAKNSQSGQKYELSEFEGLSTAQISATASTPVTFTMKREAGVITYTGTFDDGEGSGSFNFVPDRAFEGRMRALGVEGDDDDSLSDRELYYMALFDVSSQYVNELKGVGFKDLDLDDLIGARIHRVSAPLVREYRSFGIDDLDLGDAMAMSIHGVTPEFIRDMGKLGFRVDDSGELVALKIHGASPEFINSMRELGYTKLDADDYVAMKIHGVSPDFVRELKKLGYNDVSGDDLVAMRIHGVSSEFIRDQNAEHGEKLSIDDLVEMRIMGHHRHAKAKRK